LCDSIHDNDHLFNNCINARTINELLTNIYQSNSSISAFCRTNIDSLTKRILFINKDKQINVAYVTAAINNRIQDFETIKQNQIMRKLLGNS